MAGPLQGLRVIDFTWVLSGPFCTMLLADMGAEVIKIERPGTGDTARNVGPFIDGVGSYFLSINRGKKSVVVDGKSEEGKRLLFELIRKGDVLVENFRPGAIEKMGFGYEEVKKHNPEIIYASISGFGQSGPYRERPAYDMVVQGMGGAISITGEPNRPPVRVGFSIGDIGAGLFAAVAILAALHERKVSGKGQRIDISMMDCMMAMAENACARYFATGEVAKPLGGRHPVMTPLQVFPSKDGYVILGLATDDQWVKFCQHIGRKDLAEDKRFKTNTLRTQNHAALESILIEIMQTKTTDEWVEDMEKNGFVGGPINTIDRLVRDPQILVRGMVAEAEHTRLGKLKVVGSPLNLSRTPVHIGAASPDLGEHTEDILKQVLNLSEKEIESLKEKKVI